MLLGVDWATRADVIARKAAKQALLESPVVLLIEWLRSLQCNSLTKNLSHKFFSQDANNLIAIGKILAADIAFNNSNRFPSSYIWPESKGGVSNILIVIEAPDGDKAENWDSDEVVTFETVATIDSKLTAIAADSS
jgi:hypothetical protein